MMWLRRMYYPRLDADITGLDPLVVIEADFSREDVVEPCVKFEEVKEDIEEVKEGGDVSIKLEVSRAALNLEQEVRRSGRTVGQTTTYNSTTGKAAEIGAIHN